jgi:hypothetical protein
MSRAGRDDQTARRLALSADQIVVRLVIVLAPPLFVGAACAAATTWAPWPVVLLAAIVLGALCAAQPDTNGGLMVVLLASLMWLITVDDRETPWTLVAALALGGFHTAMAAAGSTPPAAIWNGPMRRQWLGRVAALAGVTAVAWVLEAGLVSGERRGNAAVFVTALLIVAGAALFLRSRSVRPR